MRIASLSALKYLLRVACIAMLALPLVAPTPAEAAVKHRKAPIKHKHAAKKYRPVAAKHPKVKKAKPAVRKPPPKQHVSWVPPKAVQAVAVRKTAATDKPRPLLTAKPANAAPVMAENVPTLRSAKTVCRRGGRIYLLADCGTAELPAELATGPADGEPRQFQ